MCGVISVQRSKEETFIPILIPSNRPDAMDTTHDYSIAPRDIEILHLIDLEPNRRNVSISLDDARLFECEAKEKV